MRLWYPLSWLFSHASTSVSEANRQLLLAGRHHDPRLPEELGVQLRNIGVVDVFVSQGVNALQVASDSVWFHGCSPLLMEITRAPPPRGVCAMTTVRSHS